MESIKPIFWPDPETSAMPSMDPTREEFNILILYFVPFMLVLFLGLPAWAQPSSTLSLQTAINQALQRAPIIASSKAVLSAAEGNELQAGSFANPEIGFEAENIAGSGDYRGANAAEYTYSLSQKVELGGKRISRRNLAGAERQAIQKDMQAAKLDLIRDVTIAYGNVLVADEKLKLAVERNNLAADVLANVSQRVSAARDPLIYQSQADIALATARLEHQKCQRDLQLAKRKLASYWGSHSLTDNLESAVLTSSTSPESLDVYQSRLSNTPNIQRYEDLLLARTNALQLEKSQNIPDPSFSVGVRDFRETGHQAMVAGMSMPIPVFNRNAGNIARASSEVIQAEQNARQARLDAEQALHEAWLDWQTAYAEATELQNSIIPSAQEALKLSRQGYERGRFSFLEILNAQRTLAEAQEQRLNTLQRQLHAKATVIRLTTPTGDQ